MTYTIEMPKELYSSQVKDFYDGVLKKIKNGEQEGIVIPKEVSFYANELGENVIILV